MNEPAANSLLSLAALKKFVNQAFDENGNYLPGFNEDHYKISEAIPAIFGLQEFLVRDKFNGGLTFFEKMQELQISIWSFIHLNRDRIIFEMSRYEEYYRRETRNKLLSTNIKDMTGGEFYDYLLLIGLLVQN
jgi:hypothetical protein